MSASSQATGTNELKRVFGSGQTAIVLAFWAKVRFDKDNYGEIACLETTSGGGGNRIVGIQQDTNGSGTADTFEGFVYNGSGAFNFTATLLSTADVWRFFCIVMNSTNAITIYVGTETGSLTAYNLTADFNVTELQEAVLANDNATELCDASYWGVRLWLGWSPSSGDVTAERDSVTGAPVHTADLDSHIQCATGTNPEVATTGTNWTRTGTFTTDASNPALGGGPVDTPMTISATHVHSVVAARAVARTLSATAAQTASRARALARTLSVTASTTASRIRSVSVNRDTSHTHETGAAPVRTGLGKDFSTTHTQTPTRARAVAQNRSTTHTQTVTRTRDLARALSVTAAQAASVVSGFGYTKNIEATAVQTVSMVRDVLRTRSATAAHSVTYLRNVARTLSTTAVQTPTRARAAARALSVTVAQVATSTRSLPWALSSTHTQTSSRAREVLRSLAVTTAQTPTLARSVARVVASIALQTPSVQTEQSGDILMTLNATATQVASLTRAAARTILGNAVQVPSLVRALTWQRTTTHAQTPSEVHGTSTLMTLLATATQSPSWLRSLGLVRSVSAVQVPSIARGMVRTIQRTANQTATVARNATRTIIASSTGTPQVVQGDINDVNVEATHVQTPSLTMEVIAAPLRRLGMIVGKVVSLSKVGRIIQGLKKL